MTLKFCRIALLGAALLGVCHLGAQQGEPLPPVSVGLSLEPWAYVIGEEIAARVLVRNNTAQPITLGRGQSPAGVLTLSRVNDPLRRPLATDPRGCLPKPLTLQPNEEKVFDIEISQSVTLEEGSYFITFGAVLHSMRYETQVKTLEIVPGTPVAEGLQLFTRDPGRQRHFKLVRWPRQKIDRLFLRVQDTPDGRTFKTVMLGAYLSVVKPRLNIAANGEVIILHRATPDYYVRNVFWSIPDEVVRRSSQSLLDPATADSARLKGMQSDLEEVVNKNERLKESLRLR